MIRRIAWCESAELELARALESPVLQIIAHEVQSGRSMLWECTHDKHRAYCVTRIDSPPTEFVMVAFAGSGMDHFAKSFIDAARSRGIPLRAHTVSPVIARLIRKYGFRTAEFVLRAA